MSELSTPSLFEEAARVPPPPVSEIPVCEDRGSERLAKDFTRWCSSFGAEFRNSPDVINLRTWAQKNKLKLKDSEEKEVLVEARKLSLKRIDQLMKKADVPPTTTEV